MTTRISAALLTLAFVAGQASVCAGWMPTTEARMACCEDGTCPMHQQHDAESPGPQRVITQAEADSCCASCETRSNSHSTQAYAMATLKAISGSGVVLPTATPTLVLTDAWRTTFPIPRTAVSKHVLLSVFLV